MRDVETAVSLKPMRGRIHIGSYSRHGYNSLLMIGDGATDAEACPPADGFIGFGGNQVRDSVKQLAHWFVHDFRELHDELMIKEK